MRYKIFFTLAIRFCPFCFSQNQKNTVQLSHSKDSLIIHDAYYETPKIIYKPVISYPSDVKSKEKEKVNIKATIDTLGNASDFKIMKSTNKLFNKKALELAKKYKFTPGKEDGKIISMYITWAIIFDPNIN